MVPEFTSLAAQWVGEGAALLPYFEEESVSDICLLGTDRAFVERDGKLEAIPNPFSDHESLFRLIERLVIPTGKRIDARHPFLDGTLPDGSRFHLALPPAAWEGPTLSIRKFRKPKSVSLVTFAPPGVLTTVLGWLKAGKSLLISGGTGAGKTTFLGLLMEALPWEWRWIVVEESRELRPALPHLVRLEGRPPTPDGVGEITLRTLVRQALRMRPDRLVVGECRGPEAFEMLQAMTVGHGGTLGTVHANHARGALERFEALVSLAGGSWDTAMLRQWIAHGVGGVVHLQRVGGQRMVAEVIGVEGVEGDKYRILPVFSRSLAAVHTDLESEG